MPQNKPKVNIYPFAVCIRRLTQKEIEKYTKRPQEPKLEKHKLPPHSPVTTRSMTKKKINKGQKCQTITGHPSQLAPQQKPTFTVRRHILRRCKHKTYLKCREHGCTMAYVTFNTVKDLNMHHRIYHWNTVYKCQQCKKTINTPSTWRFHRYCQKLKIHKCDDWGKRFYVCE